MSDLPPKRRKLEKNPFNTDQIQYSANTSVLNNYVSTGSLTKELYSKVSQPLGKFEPKSFVPSCAFELLQYRLFQSLRREYKNLVYDFFDLRKPPNESFNRYLLRIVGCQHSISRSIIPSDFSRSDHNQIFPVLSKEISAEIPLRLRKSWQRTSNDVMRTMNIYIKKMKRFMSNNHRYFKSTEVSSVRRRIGEMNSLLSKFSHGKIDFDVFWSTHVRPFDIEMKDVVLSVLRKGPMRNFSNMLYKKVDRVLYELKRGEVSCWKDFDKEKVEMLLDDPEVAEMKFSSRTSVNKVAVLRKHYNKLKVLYDLHSKFDPEAKFFPQVLFCLIKRYDTFFGFHSDKTPLGQGTAFHAAAPESVFEYLRDTINVSCELFASPFNCYFPRFCSAFGDIDVFFGSYGSFDRFCENIKTGSFEVGPPYTIEVQMMSATAVLDLVKKNKEEPLSFVFFVADWRDPVAEYHNVLDNSEFTTMHFPLKPKNHFYISGGQHIPLKKKRSGMRRYYNVPHGTYVYVVQNDKGREKYKVDEKWKEGLVQKFKNAKKELLGEE